MKLSRHTPMIRSGQISSLSIPDSQKKKKWIHGTFWSKTLNFLIISNKLTVFFLFSLQVCTHNTYAWLVELNLEGEKSSFLYKYANYRHKRKIQLQIDYKIQYWLRPKNCKILTVKNGNQIHSLFAECFNTSSSSRLDPMRLASIYWQKILSS